MVRATTLDTTERLLIINKQVNSQQEMLLHKEVKLIVFLTRIVIAFKIKSKLNKLVLFSYPSFESNEIY